MKGLSDNFNVLFFSLLSLLLVACSGGGGGTGSLTVGITDAPVDGADNVYVQFSGVEIQPSEGERIIINYFDEQEPPQPTTKTIDLLALQDGLRELLLDGETLPAGSYSWMRLMVNAEADGVYDSYIVISGGDYELRVPSGSQSGLKLNRPFDVPVNAEVDLTIDFDLRKSVNDPEGQTYMGQPVYYLRPTLRMVATSVAGYIHGTVDTTTVFNGLTCSAPEVGYFAYVYEGAGVTPDDIDGDLGDPITTAMIKMDDADFVYRTSLLAPGVYTVALTCEGNNDDPLADDTIVFVGTTDVTVVDGEGTMQNF